MARCTKSSNGNKINIHEVTWLDVWQAAYHLRLLKRIYSFRQVSHCYSRQCKYIQEVHVTCNAVKPASVIWQLCRDGAQVWRQRIIGQKVDSRRQHLDDFISWQCSNKTHNLTFDTHEHRYVTKPAKTLIRQTRILYFKSNGFGFVTASSV